MYNINVHPLAYSIERSTMKLKNNYAENKFRVNQRVRLCHYQFKLHFATWKHLPL